MAYWKNYRKYTSEVHALALGNNSDEEIPASLHGDDSKIEHSNSCESQESDISDQSNIVDSDELDLVVDSSDSNQNVIDDDTINAIPNCEETLKSKLAAWVVKNRCRRDATNEILEILNEHGHNLPKDSRTLLKGSSVKDN